MDDVEVSCVEKLYFDVIEDDKMEEVEEEEDEDEEDEDEEEEIFDDVLVEFGVLGFFLFSECGFFYCLFLLGRSDFILS